MKKNVGEFMGLYKNYMALKKVIEGTAYLSNDGILVETEVPVQTGEGGRKEDTV